MFDEGTIQDVLYRLGINEDTICKSNWYLSSLTPGTVITPRVLGTILDLNTDASYEVLDELIGLGLVDMGYQVSCKNCGHSEVGVIDNENHISGGLTCASCGMDLRIPDEFKMVYVIK